MRSSSMRGRSWPRDRLTNFGARTASTASKRYFLNSPPVRPRDDRAFQSSRILDHRAAAAWFRAEAIGRAARAPAATFSATLGEGYQLGRYRERIWNLSHGGPERPCGICPANGCVVGSTRAGGARRENSRQQFVSGVRTGGRKHGNTTVRRKSIPRAPELRAPSPSNRRRGRRLQTSDRGETSRIGSRSRIWRSHHRGPRRTRNQGRLADRALASHGGLCGAPYVGGNADVSGRGS